MDYGPAANGDQSDQFRRMVEAMTAWEQERFLHFMLRMANGDPRAQRVADLVATGTITRRQLLEMM